MMPLRPVGAAGQTFASSAPLVVCAWLMSDGWALTRDEPSVVELEHDGARIRITADGVITPLGDDANRTARMLLLNSEE